MIGAFRFQQIGPHKATVCRRRLPVLLAAFFGLFFGAHDMTQRSTQAFVGQQVRDVPITGEERQPEFR
ncbi:hypothetical protein MnTg04_00598 [bacterium MnTg04]|nr:hypothetical protein MnTg04_00598 [bacterium MnTg04]